MNVVYLAKRILYALFSLWVVLTVVFAMTHVLPGSAANIVLGQQATEERIETVEAELGLDRPVHVQYVDWLTDVLVGDWGTSFISNEPVVTTVAPRLWRTIQLAVLTLAVVVALAIPLGVAAAAMHNTVVDDLITDASYLGVSIPSFVSATLLLLLFTGPPLDLLPSGGYAPIDEGVGPWLTHLVLPVTSLTIVLVAHIMRQTRTEMIEALQSEYVRTARLKGLGEVTVLFKHALRNGLLPAITVIALNVGWLLGSLVIVETIFSYPGLGKLLVDAIHARDLPLIQFAILIPTAGYIFANLATDVAYTYLDPRITMGDR